MNERDLYRFLRGLLDVVFMGRRMWRKARKHHAAKTKRVKLAGPIPLRDAVTKSHVDRQMIPGSTVPHESWMDFTRAHD